MPVWLPRFRAAGCFRPSGPLLPADLTVSLPLTRPRLPGHCFSHGCLDRVLLTTSAGAKTRYEQIAFVVALGHHLALASTLATPQRSVHGRRKERQSGMSNGKPSARLLLLNLTGSIDVSPRAYICQIATSPRCSLPRAPSSASCYFCSRPATGHRIP